MYTRQFLAVSTRNETFQDARPLLDAVPITVLRRTPTLLRCSLPPIQPDSVLDTMLSPICATFADYFMTLSMWERDLVAHAMEDPFPFTPIISINIVVQRWRPQEGLRLLRLGNLNER
jgi:hypothetical protein